MLTWALTQMSESGQFAVSRRRILATPHHQFSELKDLLEVSASILSGQATVLTLTHSVISQKLDPQSASFSRFLTESVLELNFAPQKWGPKAALAGGPGDPPLGTTLRKAWSVIFVSSIFSSLFAVLTVVVGSGLRVSVPDTFLTLPQLTTYLTQGSSNSGSMHVQHLGSSEMPVP